MSVDTAKTTIATARESSNCPVIRVIEVGQSGPASEAPSRCVKKPNADTATGTISPMVPKAAMAVQTRLRRTPRRSTYATITESVPSPSATADIARTLNMRTGGYFFSKSLKCASATPSPMPVAINDTIWTARTLSEPCDRTKAEKARTAANNGRKNRRVFMSAPRTDSTLQRPCGDVLAIVSAVKADVRDRLVGALDGIRKARGAR